MATLTRSKTAPSVTTQSRTLLSGVPAPFSQAELDQIRMTGSSPSQVEEPVPGEVTQSGWEQNEGNSLQQVSTNVLSDLLPSISYVQKSCILTLNDLLSGPSHWSPIVPDRRHSMPINSQSSTSQRPQIDSSSSALQTLMLNLRQQQAQGAMVQTPDSSSNSELFLELRLRVDTLVMELPPRDATLAQALVSLLTHFNRLSNIYAASRHSAGRSPNQGLVDNPELLPPVDLFDTLKRQLSDLQVERLTSQTELLPTGASPVFAVESTLLWTRIDEELETVVALCKDRAENLPRFSIDHLPPQYDEAGFITSENPPDYELNSSFSLDEPKTKTAPVQQTQLNTDEKMRMDLEAVTMAIDRLYMIAPQLHNQRVELKSSKLAELERARREGGTNLSAAKNSKQKEHDTRDLENILDLLGKASDRSLTDQAVIIEGGMQSRLEKARQRDLEKRDAFVEKLARHSTSRRIHNQDAIRQPRTKDPNALLTLPEFIREAVPPEMVKSDPQALLSLPEFVKEPPPQHLVPSEDAEDQNVGMPQSYASKLKKKSRSRSLSAPPLAWLRPSSRGSNSRPKSRGQNTVFDVSYVAENYENLHHILVYFTASGTTPGVNIEAEVHAPGLPYESEPGCEFLQLRSGTLSSGQLLLPGYATIGKKDVKVQGAHFEVKLPTVSSISKSSSLLPSSPQILHCDPADSNKTLLDASQLANSNPISFICASCSLPLIHSARICDYRDLPSEHWEELVEAWMCHSDQKLHEHVVQRGRDGFWPKDGQALVGGSYILFRDSAVNQNNLYASHQNQDVPHWTLVRCLCGNVVGRCQRHDDDDGLNSIMYRMLKYAIRPVSPTSEPLKIPLTAFIVGDMMEYVSAHATYRFVLRDEEEERARILIWLFKPSMRISYSSSSTRIIPKTGSILAAKVLFKLLGPGDVSTDLKTVLARYPGFPQAEYLSYPMDICQRLAAILKETNSVYPDHMRRMADLDVGWLRRL